MKVLVIGGNRYFGRHLVSELLSDGHEVTLLNRGSLDDRFGQSVERLRADRSNAEGLAMATKGRRWDLVYDQVCYAAEEARSACKLFSGKTSRYIVTSTESVYDNGFDQHENRFDPLNFDFTTDAQWQNNYQAAKRQVESIFSKQVEFEVAIVRPSLVLGVDDHTGRLKWHLDRIDRGLPVYFPNLDIRSDFIRSDQAGLALKTVGLSSITGAVNCTAPGSISLRALIELCEQAVGKKIKLAASHEGENHSPYGGDADKTMNTDLLAILGQRTDGAEEWLPALIDEIVSREIK